MVGEDAPAAARKLGARLDVVVLRLRAGVLRPAVGRVVVAARLQPEPAEQQQQARAGRERGLAPAVRLLAEPHALSAPRVDA